MARGINETDVWEAADALLLEGARPTIERVRLKIGRGSPNTVSPFLETWFKHLGGRIKDPRAFAAPLDVPDPVLQVAQHFWKAALAQTRLDFDQRLQSGLAEAHNQAETHRARANLAEAEAAKVKEEADQLRRDLSEAQAALHASQLAAAALEGRLEQGAAQAQELREQLSRQESLAAETEEAARKQIAAANERSDGAQRRAALEIEAERTLRAKADKRADALERRLEAVQAESTKEVARLAERVAELGREAERAKSGQARDSERLQMATSQIDLMKSELAERTSQLDAMAMELKAALSAAETASRLWEAYGTTRPQRRSKSPRGSEAHK